MRTAIWTVGLMMLAGCGFANLEDGADGGPIPGTGGGNTGVGGSAGGNPGKQDVSAPAGLDEATQTGNGGAGGGAGAGGTSFNLAAACIGKQNTARTVTTSLGSANSHASAGLARDFLNADLSPLPVWVRTQDFLNFYSVSLDAQPPVNGASTLDPKMLVQMKVGLEPNTYDLLVAVQAPSAAPKSQLVVTFVLDTSPSMSGTGLSRAKAAIQAMVKRMSVGDAVRILTTNASDPEIVADVGAGAGALAELETVGIGPEASPVPVLVRALDDAKLAPAGSIPRVFLVGDGAGEPADLPANFLEEHANGGRFVSAIATGPAQRHQDRLFRAATLTGRGHYLYVDDLIQVDQLIGRHFDALFGIAFDDMKLELDLPWYFDLVQNPTEQTTTVDATRPQYMGPGGRSSYLFKLRICDPNAINVVGGSLGVRAVWSAGKLESSYAAYDLDSAPATPELDKAVVVFDYAEALKTLDDRRLDSARQRAVAVSSAQPADTQLSDIAQLLSKHPVLASATPAP